MSESMWRYIEYLREKPKSVRNQVAFLTALASMVIIVVIWSLSLPARIVAIVDGPAPVQAEDSTSSSRWLGFIVEMRDNLTARVSGSNQATESMIDSTGIDLGALRSNPPAVKEAAFGVTDETALPTDASSATSVWQREYPASEGTLILIATTSAETANEPASD